MFTNKTFPFSKTIPKYLIICHLKARNVEYGLKSVEELKKDGLNSQYHQLDIENLESINNFAKYLKEKYGGIDVLVNNAAILIAVNDILGNIFK